MALSPHWFMKEDFLWRSCASLAWIVILLPSVVAIYSLLLSFDVLHPITWLSEWFFFIFSFKMVAMVIVLMFSTLFVTFLNVRHIRVIPVVRRNCLSYLLDLLEPLNAVQVMAVTVSAALTAWFMTGQMGVNYTGLVVNCSGLQAFCLNEKHLMVVIYSGFTGFIFSIQFFLECQYVMDFSPVQQVKFIKIRDFISPSLIQCGVASIKHTLYFLISYFLFGSILKSWLLTSLQLNGTADAPLNSFHGFLQFGLLWKLWIMETALIFLWKLGIVIFKVYNSESYAFLIDTPYADQMERCLHSVLSPSAPSIVRHLAFLDLSLLSRHSIKRRSEVFSLSQPGHHSHNWNRILAECLSTIYFLTNQLTAHTQRMMIAGGGTNGASNAADAAEDVWTPQLPRNRTTVQSLGPTGVHSPLSQELSSPRKQVRTPCQRQYVRSIFIQVPKNYLKVLFERLSTRWIKSLKELHIVVYLTKPFQDYDQQMIFRESQLYQWALEGLSNLVVASYSEDTYGVVQQSLPDIITAMLRLHSAINKYSKLIQRPNSIHTNNTLLEQTTAAYKQQNVVHDSLRTAIHRIVAKFGQHLKGVHLSTEDEWKLSQFFNYVE